MIKKLWILITILFFISSCVYDKYYIGVLQNNSSEIIQVEITTILNSEFLKLYANKLFTDSLEGFKYSQTIKLNNNLISKFKLMPKSKVILWEGPSINEKILNIDEIKIKKNNHLIIKCNNKKDIFDLFDRNSGNKYTLIIN